MIKESVNDSADLCFSVLHDKLHSNFDLIKDDLEMALASAPPDTSESQTQVADAPKKELIDEIENLRKRHEELLRSIRNFEEQ
jgi:hypothetical protein